MIDILLFFIFMLLLGFAAVEDFFTEEVSNITSISLIFVGILFSWSFHSLIIGMFFFITFYILYCIGMFGAADVKIIMAISIFFGNGPHLVGIFLISLINGIGVITMMYKKKVPLVPYIFFSVLCSIIYLFLKYHQVFF